LPKKSPLARRKWITDRTSMTDHSWNSSASLKQLLWLSAGSYCHVLTTMWTSALLVYVAMFTVQIQMKRCLKYVHESNYLIHPCNFQW
jgi:hypothetical protein